MHLCAQPIQPTDQCAINQNHVDHTSSHLANVWNERVWHGFNSGYKSVHGLQLIVLFTILFRLWMSAAKRDCLFVSFSDIFQIWQKGHSPLRNPTMPIVWQKPCFKNTSIIHYCQKKKSTTLESLRSAHPWNHFKWLNWSLDNGPINSMQWSKIMLYSIDRRCEWTVRHAFVRNCHQFYFQFVRMYLKLEWN